MATTFNIEGSIDNGLGLMYFNPQLETLIEVSDASLNFAVYPYEKTIRRFYLCGDLIYNQRNLMITAEVSDSDLYSVKILIGSSILPKLHEFDTALPEVYFNTSALGSHYTNAIPVDILIESLSSTEKTIELLIQLADNTNIGPPVVDPGGV